MDEVDEWLENWVGKRVLGVGLVWNWSRELVGDGDASAAEGRAR